MKSGKTRSLYAKMGELQHLGVPYAAYKPVTDVRDQGIVPRGYIASGGSAMLPNCEKIGSLSDIPVRELVAKGIRRLFIEEGSMLGYGPDGQPIKNHYIDMMRAWGAAGISHVEIAGIDLAANGHEPALFRDAHRWGARIILHRAGCEAEINGTGVKCAATARATVIISEHDGRMYDPDTLPDVLPEGAPELRDLRFLPVCADHLIVPPEKMRPFIVADATS